jgi:hypothetical protein
MTTLFFIKMENAQAGFAFLQCPTNIIRLFPQKASRIVFPALRIQRADAS